MKKSISIKLLLVVVLIASTTITLGDGLGSLGYYCKKNKYYDLVAVKFPYKKLTLRSAKLNGTTITFPSEIIDSAYKFRAYMQLFQSPNKTLDSIGAVTINGYEFVK